MIHFWFQIEFRRKKVIYFVHAMASNEVSTTDDGESEDQATCCICLHTFNDLERKPKFLPCFHTVCVTCIKVSSRFSQYIILSLMTKLPFVGRKWSPVHLKKAKSLALRAMLFVLFLQKVQMAFQQTIMPLTTSRWNNKLQILSRIKGNKSIILNTHKCFM